MEEERPDVWLSRVLRGNRATADIPEEARDVMEMLLSLLVEGTADLTSFARYLEQDCEIAPRAILGLAESLCDDADARRSLGKKAVRLWLQYKIYEAMDILRNPPNSG